MSSSTLSLGANFSQSEVYKITRQSGLKMATSIASLASSLSSLSFSSQISYKPNSLSVHRSNSVYVSKIDRISPLVVSATIASPTDLETDDLKKYVKSRLPGGFAAQTNHGTGRRKSAIARVVLQEGDGKVIINYRDAKVISTSLFCVSFLA